MGCPFLGKISTPAQLGAYIAPAPAPTVQVVVSEQVVTITLPQPPEPFTRGEKGGIYVEKDGITHKIYEYDAFPVELAYDEQLGFETMRIRHYMPQEGWKECVLQSSLLARPVDFETKLRDQHIQPLLRNEMSMYFDSYMRKLRSDTKLRKLFRCQGWKEDNTEFVLGDKLFRPGEVVQAGHTHGAKGFLEHFRTKGELGPWRDLTWAFNTPSLEPHAFMLLVAFAAPLLQIANRKGFTICALGDTGTGKSTMAQFMASVYGHPEKTWAGMDDTPAARYERLGAYYALPVYIDEASTIDPEDLRKLIYSVATGKGRGSLKQDRTFREGAEWATVLVTSTNDSLQAKLQIAKQNAEAESMRLFEFRFPRVSAFGEVAKLVPIVVNENYGVAGAKYIEYIVNNMARVKAEANDLVIATERTFGMDPRERFWQQAVALSIYGGQLAREAGVIDFDPERIKPWLLTETQSMRKSVSDNRVGAAAILAQYLDAHVGERVVVMAVNEAMSGLQTKPTRGTLSQRYEPKEHLMWVAVKHVRDWLTRHHFDFASTRDELMANGVLVNDRDAKALGGGTDYAGGSVLCWRIATDHPALALREE